RDVFVGTTAERTIRSVECPVLMVNATPAGQYRHVLQTTDLSVPSRDGLQRFQNLGLGKGAEIHCSICSTHRRSDWLWLTPCRRMTRKSMFSTNRPMPLANSRRFLHLPASRTFASLRATRRRRLSTRY